MISGALRPVHCCVNFLYKNMSFDYIVGRLCKRKKCHFLLKHIIRIARRIVISIKMADQSNSKRRTGNVCKAAMKEPLQTSDLAILQQERLFQIF